VVGYKPTYGRVSTGGVIPLAPSLDHVGWFTQDVSGSALAAAVLCSNWSAAPATGRPILGIPKGPYLQHADDEARRAVETAAEDLRLQGYEVRRVDLFPDFEEIARRHRLILAAEAARVHAEWFRLYGSLYHEKTADLIRAGQAVDEADLAAAQAARNKLQEFMGDLMQSESIDGWLAPAAVGAAPRGLESTGDPVMSLPWTHIGFPAIALPFAVSASGLPIGIQLVAGHGADERLLVWAAEIERHLSSDRTPAMRHTAAGSAA
ncbi:MAG TPA: amidase family protein, partial [Anaerolineales bacterium]|nr:amidase family protein [Anaerolineales bacterium]